MAENDTVLVLTRKGIETMVAEGGCAYWRANAQSLSSCTYIVATRNARAPDREGDEPHGAAFMVGEVDGVSLHEDSGRYIIKMKRFACLKHPIPEVWTPGGSNPVHYARMADLPISLKSLKWEPWPAAEFIEQPLTMAQAKRGLALTFGVDPEQIEITVKG